jgi:opacity protein-like surface antigen
MFSRTFGLHSTFAVSLLITTSVPALAADVLTEQQFEERYSGQAVSAFNFKIEAGYLHADFGNDDGFGGAFDSAEGTFVQGAVSVPLGTQFGFQLDAGMLQSEVKGANGLPDFDVDAHGIGGHLFWRDPSKGLLGLYAHQTEYDFDRPGNAGLTTRRYGAEAEGYFGNYTLKGFVGKDELDWNFAVNDETYLVAKGEVDFYLNDNFMLFAGVDHSFEETSAVIGMEAMAGTGAMSPSFFANASFGGDSQSMMAGLRIYFGPSDKSLKARHREDDPAVDLFGNFDSIGSCLNNALSGGPKMKRRTGDQSFQAIEIKPRESEGFKLDGCDSGGGFRQGPPDED